jgi:outer membrane protein assembly factor BamB
MNSRKNIMIKDNRSKKIVSLILILFTLFNSNIIQLLSTNLKENPKDNIKHTPESSATVTELWSFETGRDICSSAAIADIDSDGKPEVFFGSYDWYLYALNGEDGSEIWKFRTQLGIIGSSPALGDIDNDGKLEVVFGNWDRHLYALDAENGNQIWNFTTGDGINASPSLGDIDGDGKLEVVVCSRDSKIYAINGEDGSLLWNYTTGGMAYSSAALGDVDNDGKLEVVSASWDNTTYALNGEDGTVLWTYVSEFLFGSSVSLGDLNNDGKLEAVVGFASGLNESFYALNGENGTVIWRCDKRATGYHCVALGDVDNDGFLEVGIGLDTLLNGEDGSEIWSSGSGVIGGSSPAFADVDGDGKMEIVAGSSDYKVYALNCEDGSISWSFNTTSYVYGSAAFGDLDNDGELEVVIGSRDHIMYAIDPSVSGDNILWQGDSGDLDFKRTRNQDDVRGTIDLPPVCIVNPMKNGVVTVELDVGSYFDIYMGYSYDDHEISEVRFTSDGLQDGISTGTWSNWYDWDTSSGNWDASNKKMQWLFGSGGHKEVWAELKDNNSQITRSRAYVTAIYNITQDPRLLVKLYSNKTKAFGDVELTIRLYDILPNGDLGAYRDALEDWGLEFYDFTKIHSCWLLEIGRIDKILDLIQSTVSDLLTPTLRQWFNGYLSDDGCFRIVLTSMSDFSELKSSTTTELLEILVKIFLHQQMLEVDYDTFQKFKKTFEIFFEICVGSDKLITKLKLKPDFLKESAHSLFKSFIMELANYYNFEVTRLMIYNNVISSSVVTSYKKLTEFYDYLYDTIKLGIKIGKFMMTGGLDILLLIKIGTKTVNFVLDYMMHYEAGKYGWLVDQFYAFCDFIDPPVAKLDLQIRNATTGEILLGYDPIANTTRYFCDYGFFTGDLESQFAFIDPSFGPLNISIINSHLDPSQSYVYLNQSVFFGLTNRTEFYHTFSYIRSNQSISTIVNYSTEDGLTFNQIQIEMLDVGNTWTTVKVMDINNNTLDDAILEAFLSDVQIPYTLQQLSVGVYNLTFDSSVSGREILLVANKKGSFSSAITIPFGVWTPLEELTPSIPFHLIPIIYFALLSIIILIMKFFFRMKKENL